MVVVSKDHMYIIDHTAILANCMRHHYLFVASVLCQFLKA